MNRFANANFAQEVPQELIVVDKSAKAFTPAAEALREFRRRRREAQCLAAWDECLASYDLLYLFDDKEIWEERADLILEEKDYPHWWTNQPLDSDVEYYERLKREAANASEDFEDEDLMARDVQEPGEHQFWADLDGDWRDARYVDGLGYVNDAYDSGHDEPNGMNEPYPPVNGARFVDLRLKKRCMKICLDEMRRRSQRRAYEASHDLRKQWRLRALNAMRAEADSLLL